MGDKRLRVKVDNMDNLSLRVNAPTVHNLHIGVQHKDITSRYDPFDRILTHRRDVKVAEMRCPTTCPLGILYRDRCPILPVPIAHINGKTESKHC